MKKTTGFMVQMDGYKAETVEGEELSTSGAMISVVKTTEGAGVNPLPEKHVVRMYSVHNLLWIDPIYENDDETTIAEPLQA